MTLTQSIIIIAGSLAVMAAFGFGLDWYLKSREPEEKYSAPKNEGRKRDPKTGRFIKG